MKKSLLLNFIFVFAFVIQTFAQGRTVTGTVTSSADGSPLPGVTVLVKGTTTGTITDIEGKYSVSVPSGGTTLVFRAIGYESIERAIGNQANISVALGVDTKTLGEVVVTALGITRDERSLGYTTQQISSEELTKARETNVVNSLAGKVAGVRITSQSGTPGGSTAIQIRGNASFGGSSPIFVIDGLPVSNQALQLGGVSSVPQGTLAIDFGNRAGDISPDDIETISVLKGAAATALYGARARDGAIIITTKRGAKGKTSVTFNSSARFDNVLKLPNFQNEYAQGNQGVFNLQNTNGWGPKINEVQDQQFDNFLGEKETLRAYPNNVEDFYKTGHTYINSLAFDGGGDNGDFRLGYTNTYQDGIVEAQKLKRNSINLNAGRTISSKLNVRTTLNYVSTIGENRPVQSSNNPNILSSAINGLPRTVDINKVRNNYVNPVTGEQITLTPGRTGNNPFWIINNNKNYNNVERVYGNAILTYKPLEWLTLTNNFGSDWYYEFRRAVTRPGTIGALQGNFFTANVFNRTLNNDFMVSADRKIFEGLDLKVLAGVNNYDVTYRREQSDAQNLTVDQLYTFSNAGTVATTNTYNQRRIIGAFGEIGLSYKDFLYLNVTGRNDWSSTLPKNNNSYFYPSVSSSFVFTEFVPENNILNFGKLRASWANVGSDTDPYQLAFTYAAASTAYAQYSQSTQYPFNGVLGFSIPGTIPPMNLRPQNQKSVELGADLRFLDNRVRLDFTYYNTKTSDQIIALSIPRSTGYAFARVNAGSITNKGYEVILGISPFKTSDFSWDTDFNFSANRQSVGDFPENVSQYSVASGWSSLQLRARPGEAIGIFGMGWDRDPDGNIIINPATGLRQTKTDVRFGNVLPDWMLGVNNSFTYKGVNLGVLVDIRKGGVMYSGTAATLRSTGLAEETLENRGNIFIDKGVIKQADGTFVENTVPVQSMQDFWSQFGTANTEANIYDASYVKLREVRLAYALPSGLFTSTRFIKGIDLGVEGRNLWIIHDNVPHVDPEVNFFGPAGAGEGVEFNSMPSTRTYGFNLRARF